jgi:hypothetical protein
MTYKAENAAVLVDAREFSSMDEISCLGTIVLGHHILILVIVHIVKVNGRILYEVGRHGRNPDDAHRILRRTLGCLDQQRREKVHKEEMSQGIGALLQFVALHSLGTLGRHHDACVVPQNIKTRLVCEEVIGRRFDGCQVVELQLEEEHIALGLREESLDLVDGLVGALLGTSCNPDSGILLEQNLDKFLAYTTISASDDEDLSRMSDLAFERSGWKIPYLASLITEILLGERCLVRDESASTEMNHCGGFIGKPIS